MTTLLSVLALGVVMVVGYKKVQSKQMTATHVTIYILYMHMDLFKEMPYVFRKNNHPFDGGSKAGPWRSVDADPRPSCHLLSRVAQYQTIDPDEHEKHAVRVRMKKSPFFGTGS